MTSPTNIKPNSSKPTDSKKKKKNQTPIKAKANPKLPESPLQSH